MIALRGLEADGHLSDPPHNSQLDLHILARETQLTAIYRSQRRSTSGSIGPHRPPSTGTTDTLSYSWHATNFNPNTNRAISRSSMPIHRHTVHCTKADISYHLPTTGHSHLQ